MITHVAAVCSGEDVVLGDDDPAAKVVRTPAAPKQHQRRLAVIPAVLSRKAKLFDAFSEPW